MVTWNDNKERLVSGARGGGWARGAAPERAGKSRAGREEQSGVAKVAQRFL